MNRPTSAMGLIFDMFSGCCGLVDVRFTPKAPKPTRSLRRLHLAERL